MSQNYYNIGIIDLQDKSLLITNTCQDVIDEKKTTIINVIKDINSSNKHCKHCGSISINTNSYHIRTIRYLDIAGFKSIIRYKQRRFICKDCKKTFNEDCSLVEKYSTISNPTKRQLLEECRKKQTYIDISNRVNVSHTTVANTFNEHISDFRNKLTEIICIDEFKASTIAGTYALILGDPISGKILEIMPSRKQEFIYDYFNKVPKEERLSVKYVVTDLFESYRTIVSNLFWKSIHIADRFHWIRLVVDAFNNLRIRIMNSYKNLGKDEFKGKYNKYSTYYHVIKKYAKLLLVNRYSREAWFFDQTNDVYYLKKNMTLQEIIEYIVNQDADMEEGYTLLQELYKISKISTYENARKNLLEWIDKVNNSNRCIKEFDKVALTYKSWMKEIVNSFIINPDTKTRLTNGFIEGKNNFCKVIKRIGFGYKNFDSFRAKILYTNDQEKPYKN